MLTATVKTKIQENLGDEELAVLGPIKSVV